MDNERANLHELKLSDLREQLKEANRTISTLKEAAKEREKLAEKIKDKDADIAKAVKEAVEEEKKKSKRLIAKQDAVIKALDKKLTEEQSAKEENETNNNNLKLQLSEMEAKYKQEINSTIEQFQAERLKMKDDYKRTEGYYKALISDKEKEMNEIITKNAKEREGLVAELTKQQSRALSSLKGNVKGVLADKDRVISVLNTRLDEASARIIALDASMKEVMNERQKDLKEYADIRQADENRFREEFAIQEKYHSEELGGIYERIKGVVTKKDETISVLKADLVLAQKKISEISML